MEEKRLNAREAATSLRSWPTSFLQLQKQQNFFFKNWWILCCLCYDLPSLKNNSGLQTMQQYVVGNFTQKIWRRSVWMLGKGVGCWKVDQLLSRNYQNNTTLISPIDGFCVAHAMICSVWKTIERNASSKKCVVTNFTQKNWTRSASIPERSLSPKKVGQLLFRNSKNYKTLFQ